VAKKKKKEEKKIVKRKLKSRSKEEEGEGKNRLVALDLFSFPLLSLFFNLLTSGRETCFAFFFFPTFFFEMKYNAAVSSSRRKSRKVCRNRGEARRRDFDASLTAALRRRLRPPPAIATVKCQTLVVRLSSPSLSAQIFALDA